jgi:hypothetical protein
MKPNTKPSQLDEYLTDTKFHSHVSLKLPRKASDFDLIEQLLPELKILWCFRDPRDVIASMVNLHFPLDKILSASWITHPTGARIEISNSVPASSSEGRRALAPYIDRYDQIQEKRLVDRQFDEVLLLALCVGGSRTSS